MVKTMPWQANPRQKLSLNPGQVVGGNVDSHLLNIRNVPAARSMEKVATAAMLGR